MIGRLPFAALLLAGCASAGPHGRRVGRQERGGTRRPNHPVNESRAGQKAFIASGSIWDRRFLGERVKPFNPVQSVKCRSGQPISVDVT